MRAPTPFLALFLALPSAAGAGAGQEAPDGRRGLGEDEARVAALFRQPSAEEEELLASLRALPGQVAMLAANAEGLYRTRDYFDLLEPREPATLGALHVAFRSHAADPAPLLRRGGPAARALARMLLDARFRTRMEVLDGFQRDADELVRGLAVLEATADGWARLSPPELRSVARRVDLAAALLRAREKDLQALREPPRSQPDVGAETVGRLAGGPAEDGEEEWRAELDRALGRATEWVFAARALLFSTRLAEVAAAEIAWRDAADASAETRLAAARESLPEGEEREEERRRERGETKTDARRRAYATALEGLAHDPLDDELTYLAARASRYVGGTLEALSLYDRFLALRGIRSHDDRTIRGRDLDPEEEDALFYVQHESQVFEPPPTDPPEPPGGGG